MGRYKLILFIVFIIYGNKTIAQKITNNYRKVKIATNEDLKAVRDSVTIRTLSQPGSAPTTTNRTIFDLSERGQSALIEAYADALDDTSKTKTTDIRRALLRPLNRTASDNSPRIFVENIKYYIRLSFNVRDQLAEQNPSNRISSLRLNFNIPDDSPLKLDGFVNFQTQYETVALGTIQRTTTRNFSLTGGVGLSFTNTRNRLNDTNAITRSSVNGATPNVSGTFTANNNTQENATLNRRILTRTGTITDNIMTIYMEGAPGRNLNGVISVDIEVEAKESETKAIDIVQYSNKNLARRIYYFPYLTEDILGSFNYDIVYRKVLKKGRFNVEGKHIVSFPSINHRVVDEYTDRTNLVIDETLTESERKNIIDTIESLKGKDVRMTENLDKTADKSERNRIMLNKKRNDSLINALEKKRKYNIQFVKKDDLKRKIFSIQYQIDKSNPNKKHDLYIVNNGGTHKLNFVSREQAKQLIWDLIETPDLIEKSKDKSKMSKFKFVYLKDGAFHDLKKDQHGNLILNETDTFEYFKKEK